MKGEDKKQCDFYSKRVKYSNTDEGNISGGFKL